jgi:hypothetical protein
MIAQPCHCCGGGLSETGVGLDRLDPVLGFVPANAKPSCGPCLAIRRTLTPPEVRLVLSHREMAA